MVYKNNTIRSDYKQSDVGTPDYSDLLLDHYISVIEVANPMHSLWSDCRWNKLTMAHGCYWGKCTFCDISLDYIKLYEPITAKILVDRMEELIAQTGENGFHFVDEAAPPALMREVALEILRRNLSVTWWTNIRFEKSFTKDLCLLLKASGCIAVSGGLEVASDRLLKLIDKVHDIKVNDVEINDFLPSIYEKLEGLDREELIKRFVSIEFNTFLSYYENAPDLNDSDHMRGSDRGSDTRGKRRDDENMTRFFINIGRKDKLNPAKLIGLINDQQIAKNIEIGQIEILDTFSFFELDKNYQDETISSFQKGDVSFEGRGVNVEITEKKRSGRGGGSGGGGRRSIGRGERCHHRTLRVPKLS